VERVNVGQSTETTTTSTPIGLIPVSAATLGPPRHFIVCVGVHADQISNGIHLPKAKYAETGRCTCRSLAGLSHGPDCPQTTTYPRNKEARLDDLFGSSFGASSVALTTKGPRFAQSQTLLCLLLTICVQAPPRRFRPIQKQCSLPLYASRVYLAPEADDFPRIQEQSAVRTF
jgi:hypothetical protein